MENIVALLAATVVLVMIPGPNVAVIVAKSIQHGFWAGFAATLGTTAGVAVQLMLITLSVAALIETVASGLVFAKWIGVIYLVGLGVRTWTSNRQDVGRETAPSQGANFGHGFIVAILNPKVLLFNAAFLPQFVDSDKTAASQMIVLSSLYLLVLLVGDLLWALFAASAQRWLKKYGRLSQRLTGGFLVGSGIGLALSRRSF